LANAGVNIEGAKAIARSLRHNKSLRDLDLSRNEIRDLGALAFAKLIKREENHDLSKLDLSFTMIGDEGILGLYSSLATISSSSRDMKVRDFYLLVNGNKATMNLRDYAPDLDPNKPRVVGQYEGLILPLLAKSKQTRAYCNNVYINPAHDVPVWARHDSEKKKEISKIPAPPMNQRGS